MKMLLSWIALSLLATTTAVAGSAENWTVLPGSEATKMLKQCSRPAPNHIDGTWEIPPAVAQQLEADLPRLATVASDTCCTQNASVKDPQEFARQYVGIVIQGHRYVYINAFPPSANWGKWRTRVVGACDGGMAFWGALYDPTTHRFSQLAFNGPA